MIETKSPSSPPPPSRTAPRRAALLAALAAGLVAQLLVVVWLVYSEVPAKVFISSWSCSMPGFLLLAALLRWRRRAGAAVRRLLLDQRPLLLVYAMVSVSGILVGYGHIQLMFHALAALTWRGADMRWQR